jgi:hypothetical protein
LQLGIRLRTGLPRPAQRRVAAQILHADSLLAMAARSKPSQVIDQMMGVGALGVLAVPGQEPIGSPVHPS